MEKYSGDLHITIRTIAVAGADRIELGRPLAWNNSGIDWIKTVRGNWY
jgi:hypothetical protein